MQVVKHRETKETKISVKLNLNGQGLYGINTGILFFNHMLEQVAHHSMFDIDIDVVSYDKDPHHIVEDVAITFAQAFNEALGDKKGITRYSNVILPMDDALCMAVVDISGRAYCKTFFDIKDEKTSDFETVLLAHFYNTFAQNAFLTLYMKQLDGTDTHHIIEASFKAFARALKVAVSVDNDNKDKIPSTKGCI